MRRLVGLMAILGLPVQAPVAAQECVIFEWAVSPGVWTEVGTGDTQPVDIIMNANTRWRFDLGDCSLTTGTCNAFGSGSLAFQDGTQRTQWYTTGTVPTVSAMGDTVTYSFAMLNASVPLGGPRSEDVEWTLTAELPSSPTDSPSAADLMDAVSIDVSIEQTITDLSFGFTFVWSGTATQTQFTSCTPAPAQLSIDDVTQNEGSGGGTTAFDFTVSRDVNSDEVEVTVQTMDGTAIAGADYTAAGPTTLTFPAGGTLTQDFTVNVAADDLLEPDQAFTVELSMPSNATIADGSGTGTIQNDDTAATLSVGDVTLAEGSGGGAGTSFSFTVSRSHVHDPVTLEVDTADGTAVAGSDFTGIVGSVLTFPASGTLSQPVLVTVAADDTVELDETFTVVLSSPTNATIADESGTGTIENDDAATLSIGDGETTEGSGGGTTPIGFTVTLDAAVDAALSVDFSTADGTAEDETGDGDYVSSQVTLDFDGEAGETETLVVFVTADDRPEMDEDFFVDLFGVAAGGRAVTIDVAQGRGSILDDDDACPGFDVYRQPFDSPPSPSGHPATSGGTATFEDVVDGGGMVTSLPAGPITAVRWWGFGRDGLDPCALDPSVPFDLTFAADAAGAPGAVLAQRTGVAAQLSDAGGGVVQIELTFAPLDGAGVSWIAVERATAAGCAFEWLAEEVDATYDDQVFTASGLAPGDAYLCVGDPPFFSDGFESGDTSAWSTAVP